LGDPLESGGYVPTVTEARFLPMSAQELRDYLLMARALISQGAVEVDRPDEKFVHWARFAIRSPDDLLNQAVAKLAAGTALARGERYIEMQLISPRAAATDPIVDLEVPDRFALLRMVAADHRQFSQVGLERSLDDQPAVLYSSFDAAKEAANHLRGEEALSRQSPAVLLYAATYQPVLPAEFLEEGTDPLAPAREYLETLTKDQAEQIVALNNAAPRRVTL
jgi:hypothetical protein